MLGRRGGPSVWAIALLVLAMTLGGCSGAATTVTGKTFFQRLGTGARKLYDRLINRKGNFPGLERKPPLTSLTDPANAQSDNPAISEAAKVKAEEDQAAQKIKAIKYLGTIGCGCHPDVRDALFAALDDCNADVRYAAAEAFETAANAICASCNTKSCCDREVLMKLWKMGYEKKAGSTCWLEPSARVRSAARRAFKACKQNCLPVPPPTDGPDEGPTATPAEAEGEGDATADASASGKPSGTQTAARSRGMEAAGGVFYLPGARYLAGKSNPTGGAQQAGEVVAGAPPRPTLADAPDPEASADDLNGEAIPPRPDGLGGPPMVAASNRSATPAPTGPVGPTASANAPASLDGPASQAGPASQNGPGANPAAYNNPGYNNNGYANNNAGYNANGYAGAPGYRGPNGDASAFGPPPGGVPGGQVAANLNAPAQPIQEPRLTAEQLESRRRALQAAVYNQQVEAELARQQESQAAQERQAIAWKQEQERRELERLQRMAAQPRPTDLGAAAPNGQFAPTPNAPASLGPNPTGPTFPAGNSGGMPTLVAPGGPLNTVAAPQTQFTSQQNPA
ncbi:MAG TPA: hypothetical protein VGE52_11290, partial [Pirellulales bacterium]